MAVFLLKTTPRRRLRPARPPAGTIFADVPARRLRRRLDRRTSTSLNVTGGCLTNPLRYCPTNTNNRQQMAVFITKTFGLQ